MQIDTNRLLCEMKKKGMKQKELANAIGVEATAVCRYVKGQRQPRGNVLVAMAEALEVTPEYLCGLGIEHEGTAYMRARGNILHYASEWTVEQRKELIDLLVR